MTSYEYKKYMIVKQETMIVEHTKAIQWHNEQMKRCKEKIKELQTLKEK